MQKNKATKTLASIYFIIMKILVWVGYIYGLFTFLNKMQLLNKGFFIGALSLIIGLLLPLYYFIKHFKQSP